LQNDLEFSWIPFREDIGIFGMKGSGKTSKARDVLLQVPNLARWIWSPQKPLENYKGFGEPVSKIEDLKHGAYLWVGDYSKKTFLKICARATKYMRNLLFVVDDVHEQVTKQFIPEELDNLISSGRNRGISGIYISTTPAKVHSTILGSCSHIFGYQLNLVKHIEWFRDNYFGNEAWLLLPKDLRNKHYVSNEDPDQLPKYSFLYRKDSDTRTQIILSEPLANAPDIDEGFEDEETEEETEEIE